MTTSMIVAFCVAGFLVSTARLVARHGRYTKFLSKTGVDSNLFTFENFSNKEHNEGLYGKTW